MNTNILRTALGVGFGLVGVTLLGRSLIIKDTQKTVTVKPKPNPDKPIREDPTPTIVEEKPKPLRQTPAEQQADIVNPDELVKEEEVLEEN